jgi:hypothetical protein
MQKDRFIIDQMIILSCIDNENRPKNELAIREIIPNTLNKKLKITYFTPNEIYEVI